MPGYIEASTWPVTSILSRPRRRRRYAIHRRLARAGRRSHLLAFAHWADELGRRGKRASPPRKLS